MNRRHMAMLIVAGVAVMLVPAIGSARLLGPNIVRNPGFEAPSSGPTSFTGSGGGGLSAAPDWGVFNNGNGTTSTEILPSTAGHGQAQMIHVTTNLDSSGLVQCCYDIHGFRVKAQVKVVSGAVKVCVGPLGSPPCQMLFAGGGWQRMQALSPAGDAGSPNEIVIYSAGASGAEFYVDNISIQPVTL